VKQVLAREPKSQQRLVVDSDDPEELSDAPSTISNIDDKSVTYLGTQRRLKTEMLSHTKKQ
jgi:hypothetical protein